VQMGSVRKSTGTQCDQNVLIKPTAINTYNKIMIVHVEYQILSHYGQPNEGNVSSAQKNTPRSTILILSVTTHVSIVSQFSGITQHFKIIKGLQQLKIKFTKLSKK